MCKGVTLPQIACRIQRNAERDRFLYFMDILLVHLVRFQFGSTKTFAVKLGYKVKICNFLLKLIAVPLLLGVNEFMKHYIEYA